jgi:ribosomal protein L11 methyltransferase
MDYTELNIPVADGAEAELLVAELAEWPFDSFAEEPGRLKAYIPTAWLPDCKGEVDALLAERGIGDARYIQIEERNWNELWESQFDPVEVDGRVVIRAPFHAPAAEGVTEVVIMPKMSFGTGHHATTWLMAAMMAERDFAGKRVLDMGSGTGVLAILAAKMGAEQVDAVDIDEWAWRNSVENVETNGVAATVRPEQGDVSAIRGRRYDAVVANINRNILLADMAAYTAALIEGGMLIMSGILEPDAEAVTRRAVELGLTPDGARTKDGWAALAFKKR